MWYMLFKKEDMALLKYPEDLSEINKDRYCWQQYIMENSQITIFWYSAEMAFCSYVNVKVS